MFSWLLEEAHV